MSGRAGRVSIVLPTYNRADTIRRAVASVQAQSFPDWELIVVDDGSRDGTADLIEGCDPRLKLIRQPNQGTAGARNTALRACTGELVAFLDSDDEWLPHHLELSVAFLDAHPGEAFVTHELWEDFGDGRIVKHYRVEIGEWYPRAARSIRSHRFDLPPGASDDHLRVYETREPIGAWGEAIVARAGYPDVTRYRGRIFEHMRFGFLMCLQPTVIRREAVAAVGFFDPRYTIASDYGFTIELCRRFPANYLSVPACIKHELAVGGGELSEGHVATGKTSVICVQDMLRFLEHFWSDRLEEPEIQGMRGLRELNIARLALDRSDLATAQRYVALARRHLPESRQARWLDRLVRLLPGERLPCQVHNAFTKAAYLAGMVRRNEMPLGELLHKAASRLGVFAPARGPA